MKKLSVSITMRIGIITILIDYCTWEKLLKRQEYLRRCYAIKWYVTSSTEQFPNERPYSQFFNVHMEIAEH